MMRSATAAAWVTTFLVGTTGYNPVHAQPAKAASPAMAPAQPAAGSTTKLQIPVEYYKLPNGLKVVLSRDTTTPTACVAVYYKI
jgi:hypothetical protein